MRIAAVHHPGWTNAGYRSIWPLQALARTGHEVVPVEQQGGKPEVPYDDLADFDVVHVHRGLLNDDDEYVERLHERGVAVWYDDDDDFSAAGPALLALWERGLGAEALAGIRRAFERTRALLPQMDLVSTPSEALAERLGEAGAPRVAVLDNYPPDSFAPQRPVDHPGFVIGWHAGREHEMDSAALGLEDVLARIMEEHGHVHVVTIGARLGLVSNRYIHVENAGYADLPNHLASFDIGIAPLEDNAFNAARSKVKVREYASAGTPWLASAVGPYLGLGKAEGGELVAAGEWHEALDRLIRSSFDRARRRRRAKAWARDHAVSRMAGLWEEAAFEAVEGAPAR